MRWLILATSLWDLWGATAESVAGEQKPAGSLNHKALDEKVYNALGSVLSEGADLYNTGYPTACSYLFQGGLMSAQAVLDHHPDLRRAIRRGLASARRQTDMQRRAWALYYVIVKVRSALRPSPAKTLWDRLGGEEKVTKIVDDFVEAVSADKEVNFFRNGKHNLGPDQLATFKKHLIDLASAVSGGPRKYTGKSMKEAHKGMRITNAEFDALMKQLKITLLRHDIKEEDTETLLKYVESTRKDIVDPKGPPKKTLWDRLGGEEGVTKIADDFLRFALSDPKVNFLRNGKYKLGRRERAELKKKIVSLASAVTGGPLPPYAHKSMKEAHKGMGITNAEFDAMKKQLRLALFRNGVEEQDRETLLRHVETIRKDIVESNKIPLPAPPTLWERLGGEEKVSQIVADFVDAVVADKKVNFSRNGKYNLGPDKLADLKKHLVNLASQLGDGPHKYRGKTMKDAHKGMGITDAEFDALIENLKKVLKKHGVKAEDRDTLLKAIEGTRRNIVEKAPGKKKPRAQEDSSTDKSNNKVPDETRRGSQDRSRAESLLEKAIEAMGGKARLAKFETGTWKGKFVFKDGRADTKTTGTLQSCWQGGGKYRMALDAKGGDAGKLLLVLNGDEGWLKEKDRVAELPGQFLPLLKDGLDGLRLMHLLAALKDKELQLACLDEIKIKDRPAVGLKAVFKGRKEIRLFFDKAKGLPLQAEFRLKDPLGDEKILKCHYGDYKEFDRLKHFTKITAYIGDREVSVELTEIKSRDKLDKSLFAKP
jgi:hemoglobin